MATSDAASGGARRNSSGLARDLEILDVLADPSAPPEGLGVLRVAELLGRDKATVSRAMATLADAGLLTRDDDSRLYRVGPRIFALAARSAEAVLVREARPYLRQLARHARETAHLSVLRGGHVITLMSELSPNEVRTASWEGMMSDPIRTPSGRVLVSDWSQNELADWYARHGQDAMLASTLSPLTLPEDPAVVPPAWLASVEGRTIVYDLASLVAEIQRIRKAGYATSDEEFERGVVAASAPIRDHTGRVIAALNVSAPKGRVGNHLDQLGVYVARAAERLSARIGQPRAAS